MTTATTEFHAIDPRTGALIAPAFAESTDADVDRALRAAQRAFDEYARWPGPRRAALLRAIAAEIDAAGAEITARAQAETALPAARLDGERGRTVGQLRLFADTIDEGSWVEARIDRGDPGRAPLPKPDLRRMLIPIGPVAVFAASNFPLAFGVAGGDTASALAAGCSVVCKAHPAQPGTADLIAHCVERALRATGAPDGLFSMLHGWSHDVGVAMVQHPITRAVGFTGSLRGGRALFDAAAGRPEPIPVYAEMGSVNPVFVFPSALDERMDAIVHGLALSITAGVGQFCTNPGVVVAMRGGALDRFIAALAAKLGAEPEGVMLYERLGASFAAGVARAQSAGATILAGGGARAGTGETHVRPTLLVVDADDFIEHAELRDEVFGPVSLVVRVADAAEMERVAAALEGQLTATIHGTSADLREQASLVEHLRRKVGRLLFNGFPTGVEVGHAMHHGGPYPASSDARTTSVGTAAITRFARPVCYQNFPDDALPEALRSRNELGIWRMIDGGLTKAHV